MTSSQEPEALVDIQYKRFAKVGEWSLEHIQAMMMLNGSVNSDIWQGIQPRGCEFSGLRWIRTGPVGEIYIMATDVSIPSYFADCKSAVPFCDIEFGIELPDDFGAPSWDAICDFLHVDRLSS